MRCLNVQPFRFLYREGHRLEGDGVRGFSSRQDVCYSICSTCHAINIFPTSRVL